MLERYFLLTDEEARIAWGPEYEEYWDELRGGYLAGYANIALFRLTMLKLLQA